MKRIEYCKDGEPIADMYAESRAKEFLKGENDHIKISSHIFILAVQALIYEGRYPVDQIVLSFNGEDILFDKNARFLRREGFCDYEINFYSRLLKSRGQSA